MIMTRVFCRVCGLEFASPRCDAITCTDTCRQRLKRGQAFAYLAGLSKPEQRLARKWHAARDASIAAHKAAVAARRKSRDSKRAVRRLLAEQEQERARERVADEQERERAIADRERVIAERERVVVRREVTISVHERITAERDHEHLVAEIVGRGHLAEMKKKREHAIRSTVAMYLKLFVKERRNDMSAEAIAAALNRPDDYPVDEIARALDQLRATGDYDRIVNEANAEPVIWKNHHEA